MARSCEGCKGTEFTQEKLENGPNRGYEYLVCDACGLVDEPNYDWFLEEHREAGGVYEPESPIQGR